MSAEMTILFIALAAGVLAAIVLVRLGMRGPMPEPALNLICRLVRVYARLWHGLRVIGAEHIPRTGPVLLASNHTTGLDPMLLQSPCPRPIRWVMLTEWRFAILEPLWRLIEPITLDRDQRDIARIRQIVRRLETGEVVAFFPEGGLQRDTRQLNPFHPGIAMVAKRSHAPIVPAFIEGTPRRRNMLWHFLQPSRSRVTFGQPYRPDPTWSRQQILDDLKQRIEALAENKTEP
jgi:1-acyl-sn-glycerol-3-phosphate acyltransferase